MAPFTSSGCRGRQNASFFLDGYSFEEINPNQISIIFYNIPTKLLD